MIGGLASAVVLAAYAWWAPVLLAGAWLATHWLLRESAVWRDRHTDEVRGAQRDSDYAYRLAVDPPASKELRLFGLAEWTIDRFIASWTRLHELQYAATRLRERPRALESAPGRDGERRGVLVARRRRGERPAQPRRGRRLCPDGGRHLPDRVRWAQFRARWRGRAGGRRLAPRARHGRDGRAARRRPTGRRGPDPRDPLPRPHLRLPGRVARPRTPRPDGARRVVARDCRSQRDRQDHAGQAAVPALRPPGRHDRGRRHRPAGLRHRRLARSGHGRVPGLHPLRAVAPRQRRAGGRAGRDRAGSARGGGRRDACRPGHGNGPRLRRGHRSLRWTVAAYRPGTRAVRRAAGGRSRAARRAHRAARRPGGIRDLRPHPDGHARVHHHSHLSPFLDRATRRPHLRARRRTRRRARHAR